jgi:hypothetical protein
MNSNINKSIEDAKKLMTPEAMNNLRHTISTEEKIDMSKKVNGDPIMVAFCKAVNEDIIKITSLSETMIKMLNSSTNTMSQSKLGEMLEHARQYQPGLICRIKLMDGTQIQTINQWTFTGIEDCKFNDMFEYLVQQFEITPTMVRDRMSKLLKPTIANNIGQFIAKYETSTHKDELVVSITTIARLANIVNHVIKVEFKEE